MCSADHSGERPPLVAPPGLGRPTTGRHRRAACGRSPDDRPREEYVADARDGAGLGFAFLDLDGTWYDPDSQAGVRAPVTHANRIDRRRAHLDRVVPLLDALPGDAYVVTVDHHS
ncbi:hypothetical protein [Nocardiopsis changdeensis]|uniref:hypothetical protein n=1 Tax=Nocardiopsis changdeensis TaxID=2831969 RepID=UPI003F471FF7